MRRETGLLERAKELFGNDGLVVPHGGDGCGAQCGGCGPAMGQTEIADAGGARSAHEESRASGSKGSSVARGPTAASRVRSNGW